MNILKLAWKNFLFKPLTNGLSIILLALGVAIILVVNQINQMVEQKFSNSLKGIDMVVGAKGSPLQLVLSAVFHLDNPTGNINYANTQFIQKNPFVKTAIPISLGDNYMGKRIVGTQASFIHQYLLKIKQGKLFANALECTIGSEVAKKTNLKIGQSFESAHGLEQSNESHHEQKYVVVGIFEPSNSVADHLILTSINSIWSIHEHHDEPKNNALDLLNDKPADHEHENEIETDNKEITALLVKFRSPMGLMSLPRAINANSNFQAALPAIEINRLYSLLGIGADALKWLAILIIFVAAVSVFITVYNSLKERKYEMALMVTMGAKKTSLFLLLFFEALIIGFLGFVLGKCLSLIAIRFLNDSSEQSYNQDFAMNFFNTGDWLGLAICLLVCLVSAYLPSISIHKMDISKTLAEG